MLSLRGRDAELARLRALVTAAATGRGSTVLLAGEAGIGKSRLVAEVMDHAASEGVRTLVGHTTEDVGAPPYWPWLQLLSALGRDHLLLAPPRTDPEVERFARQVHVVEALLEAPVLVVLEDVHRADVASLRLLVHASREAERRPAVVVATFRPDPADQVDGFGAALDQLTRGVRTIRLDLTGLDAATVADLLGPAVAPEAAAAVHAVSDGNPLLVSELARHLAAGGSLDTVPVSVREGVRRRLALRSARCIDTVAWAAVSGRSCSISLIAEASGRQPADVMRGAEEAVHAGLLEAEPDRDRYRFVHALYRDAVAGTVDPAERAGRHRALAVALERLQGSGDDWVPDLARHWEAAAVLGDREVAADWCERAARLADRRLVWDEAARLFDRALDLAGGNDALRVYRLALGSARARLHCSELAACVDRCLIAGRAALRAGRPDLAAEAVVVPEARGVDSHDLSRLAEETLSSLSADAHSLRARVLGQLVTLGFYTRTGDMAAQAAAAEAEAEAAADPVADLAAVRARHMLCQGVEHAEVRLVLAERLGHAVRAADLAAHAVWEPVWRMEALIEIGRVPEAAALSPVLRASVRTPVARWHLERLEFVLAQATGRLEDARRHASAAWDIYAGIEHPAWAKILHATQLVWLGMHAPVDRAAAELLAWIDTSGAPAFLGDTALLASTEAALQIGEGDRALALYRRLGPAEHWAPPPHMGLSTWAARMRLAAALGVLDDLPPLITAVAGHRGRHTSAGGGTLAYLGPIELWTGTAAAALQNWDNADRDLAYASATAARAGAPGFTVHADVERAEALLARGGPGDAATARSLLPAAGQAAARLGMTGFVQRSERAAGAVGPAAAGPLSPRETEVASLVAGGMSNREIARALVISERTAANHVQHILTKLGMANRREVARWLRRV